MPLVPGTPRKASPAPAAPVTTRARAERISALVAASRRGALRLFVSCLAGLTLIGLIRPADCAVTVAGAATSPLPGATSAATTAPPTATATTAPATATATTAATVAPTSGREIIPVYLDGLPVEFDVPPTIVNGRALVPFRLLAEALGCQVEWDETARRVHAVNPYSGRTVDLWIDRTDAEVNRSHRTLDVPATIVNGRTLVPLRFFGEALGAQVAWHDDTRSITVVSPPRPMQVLGYYALGNTETSSWTELFGRPFPDGGVGATDLVSRIACAWFVLDPATGTLKLDDSWSGQKRPDNWEDVLKRAAGNAVTADMMVHWAYAPTGVCDPSIYAFLRNPAAMQRAVREISGYASDFAGVNLDIELLGQRQTGDELAATRADFAAFVRLLADTLHTEGKTLTLSLHPLNSWYPGYDWQALGALADWVVIMAYGYAPKNSPEPIAKVTEAVDLALAAVPKEKLILGLLAGRNADGTPTGETPETLAQKVGLAKRRGLAGISLWRLGVWGPERLGAVRALVSRPPAAEVLYNYGPDLSPVDTTAAPPLKVAGTYYVPLLPVAESLGIPVRWDDTAGQAIISLRAYGSWDQPVTPVPEGQAVFGPAQAPEAISVRGLTYLRADYAVSLLGQFAPEDASYTVQLDWNPDAPGGPRLILAVVPRTS